MLQRIIAAIGRALDAVFNLALTPFKSLLEVMYPGIFDVPSPPVHEIEQALDQDDWELAQERVADREEALADTLTYAAETLTSGCPAAMPASVQPFSGWLAGLNEQELERILTSDKTAVYGHLFLDMPIDGLPSLDEVRPAPRVEAPAAERHLDISEPVEWPAAVGGYARA